MESTYRHVRRSYRNIIVINANQDYALFNLSRVGVHRTGKNEKNLSVTFFSFFHKNEIPFLYLEERIKRRQLDVMHKTRKIKGNAITTEVTFAIENWIIRFPGSALCCCVSKVSYSPPQFFLSRRSCLGELFNQLQERNIFHDLNRNPRTRSGYNVTLSARFNARSRVARARSRNLYSTRLYEPLPSLACV